MCRWGWTPSRGPTIGTEGTRASRTSRTTGGSSPSRRRRPTLVLQDTNGVFDVFVGDVVAGVTRRVSVDPQEQQTQQPTTALAGPAGVLRTRHLGDGRYVAFTCNGRTWSPTTTTTAARACPAPRRRTSDSEDTPDVFVRDVRRGTTTR